jgi:hypothetical protein
MEDRLQTEPRGLIRKNPAAEEMAINAAVGIERLIAEGFHNDGGNLRIRFQYPVDRRIAIENHERGQALGEQAADRGFSGCNSTRECHDLHRVEDPKIGRGNQAKKTGGRSTLRPSDD